MDRKESGKLAGGMQPSGSNRVIVQSLRINIGQNMKASIQAIIIAGLLLSGCSTAPTTTVVNDLHVVARYKIGGIGGWDLAAFDEGHRRLFLSHSDRVVVMDGDSGIIAGEITGQHGVHGIALAPDLKRGYASNGTSNTVTAFDLDTLKIVGEIKVTGINPDALLYDVTTRHLLSFNGRSANVTLIDAKSLQVTGTIDLPGKPELAVSNGDGTVFVNIEDKSEVAVIDQAGGEVRSVWPLSPGEEPTGLAIDVVHHRLFAVCANHKIIVLDTVSGRLVQELPIGEGPDSAAFDSATGLIYSSNGDGTLTVVHEDDPDHFRVVADVPTQLSARTMALDATKHRIYLPAAELGPPLAPTEEHPHPRPSIVPETFSVLVVGS